MSIALILVAVAIICLLNFLPNIKSFLRIVIFSRSLKGPRIWELMQNMQRGSLLIWLKELRRRYGSTFCIWLGLDLNVFFTDPEDVKCILGSNKLLYKSRNYKALEPWLGKGILTSGGEVWFKKRKMLTPAFHFKMLDEFKQPMKDNCRILVERLMEKATEEPFDIYPYLTLMALDIICETAMGIQVNAQLESTSEYVTAVKSMCQLSIQQSFTPWKRIEFLYKFSSDFKERKRHLAVLHGETKRVIKMRKENFSTSETSDELGIKKRLAFLDILLQAQTDDASLTDDDIQQEVDTFMFEGHDTTSSMLGFATYLLSQNKVEQQKAYEEVISAEENGTENLKYLEAVIKESLRIYPSVPFYSRCLMEDTDIRGLQLPKGVAVAVLADMVHRDEKYFPDPERFNPDRFLVDENKLHPYAFVAFSAGPRNCIGQKFAMLELKCVLSNLLRNFEILPVEGFKPIPMAELVLKSGNGIHIRLRKR